MSSEKYYLIYADPYGLHPCLDTYDTGDELLRNVKRLKDEDIPFRAFLGTELDFEPATIVQSWRIAQAPGSTE